MAAEETGEGRREQLLAAALALFGERGYAPSTMKQLAHRAGVAPGLIYHYFSGKEALLQEVVQRHSLLPELRRILAVAHDRPAEEVLTEIIGRADVLLADRRPLLRIFIREAGTQPAVERVWRGLVEEGLGLIAGYLEARVVAGELRPHNTRLVARMLMVTGISAHLVGPPPGDWQTDLVRQLLWGMRREG